MRGLTSTRRIAQKHLTKVGKGGTCKNSWKWVDVNYEWSLK